jgi:hypothetical protein
LKVPKIYVATKYDTDSPKTIASGSMTTIKEKLREFPETQWSIRTLQIKADVTTICSLIENWAAVTPEEQEDVRILPSGQVRSVKPKDN